MLNPDYNQQIQSEITEPIIPNLGTRENLRRHNPTFLSYGSPTFALASKNVIGY